MRTPDEIRSIQFTKNTMGGYKQSEVDNFIDEIAMQIETMALKMKDLDMRNRELENKASQGDTQGTSIQNILIAAQKVADEVEKQAKENAEKIVNEATVKAAEIEARCEQALVTTHEKIENEKLEAEKQTTALITETAKKVEAMTRAAKDSVEREQLLFDKLKIEMATFRKTLTAQFLEQAELIKKLPDAVPFDPEYAAKAVGFEFDKEPDFASFTEEETVAAEQESEPEIEEAPSSEDVLKTYTVNYDETEETSFDDDEEDGESQLTFDQDND